MKRKTVYLNGAPVGSAQTWHEVAVLLSELLRVHLSARDVQNSGNEGPNGFYVMLEG